MAADDDHSDNAPAPKSTETAADVDEAGTATDESSDDVDAAASTASETDANTSDTTVRVGEEPSGPPRSHRYGLVLGIAAVLLALDLISKQWAWDTLRDGTVITVIDGWAYYEFGFNTGSAFSLLRDASWSRMFFIGITLAALLYMAHLAKSLPTRFGSAFVAIGMVASGALGNLHDRFVRVMPIDGVDRHGVVDFIKVFYWEGKPWPTFNIADVALVAGVVLLLTFLWRHGDVLDAPQEQAKS